jgi:hypothetical protein
MKKTFFSLIAVAMLISQLGVSAFAQNRVEHKLNSNGEPAGQIDFGQERRIGAALTTGGTTSTTPLVNHGGPVINTPTIYIIWYGNWNQTNGSDTPAGQQIIRDWAGSIGNTPHFQLNSSYPPANSVSGQVFYGGEYTNTGTKTRLRDADILSIVSGSIGAGKLPYNPSGVYFVVTSSNISETSGFCTQYCGWHTAGNVSAGHVRYSFVGNAKRCLSGCAAQSTVSPNNNPGIDGSISVMTHELEEAATDPDLNAWYDSSGAENADKCAWTFGHFQYQTGNGAWANMQLGSRDYLIQRNLWYSGSSWFCMVDSTHN